MTAVQGQATVSRVSLSQPAALRFKDDVFFHDQITTKERATVRLLLGGKGTLTIREQSQVTLEESATPEGARRSVLGLVSGKVGAAIAHGLMKPGESVEIRTPNAVAAVRGTVLIAEYIPPPENATASKPILLASAAPGPFLAQASGTGGTSNFVVLSGQVNVTVTGQPPIILGPLQAVQVTATPTGVQSGAVQTITPAQAAQAAQGLGPVKPQTSGDAGGGKVAQAQVQVAAAVTNVILQQTAGQAVPTSSFTQSSSPANTVAPLIPEVSSSTLSTTNTTTTDTTTTTSTTTSSTTNTTTADTTTSSTSTITPTNLVQNPGFETGNLTNWTLSGAGSALSTFGSGAFSPPVGNYMAIISNGEGAVNNTTSTLSQSVQSLSPGTVYLITFNYNFMSNEYPNQSSVYNDTFEAKLLVGDTTTLLASASRDSSTFNTDKGTISGGGFSLSEGNGYTGFLSASKTVEVNGTSATLQFQVFDVGDTVVDSAVLLDSVSLTPDPPLYLLTNGQTLTGPGLDALVEVSNQSATFDSVLVSSGPAPDGVSSVSLSGPLLHAQQATLNVPFSLLGLLDGARCAPVHRSPWCGLRGASITSAQPRGQPSLTSGARRLPWIRTLACRSGRDGRWTTEVPSSRPRAAQPSPHRRCSNWTPRSSKPPRPSSALSARPMPIRRWAVQPLP